MARYGLKEMVLIPKACMCVFFGGWSLIEDDLYLNEELNNDKISYSTFRLWM